MYIIYIHIHVYNIYKHEYLQFHTPIPHSLALISSLMSIIPSPVFVVPKGQRESLAMVIIPSLSLLVPQHVFFYMMCVYVCVCVFLLFRLWCWFTHGLYFSGSWQLLTARLSSSCVATWISCWSLTIGSAGPCAGLQRSNPNIQSPKTLFYRWTSFAKEPLLAFARVLFQFSVV